MGTTISYSMQSKTRSFEQAKKLVNQMREISLDLPFQGVSDIQVLEGDKCDFNKYKQDDDLRWLLIQASAQVVVPWTPYGKFVMLPPSRLIAFTIDPGDGCEVANVGLCEFPKKIEHLYMPSEDKQFFHNDNGRYSFSYRKFDKWLDKNNLSPILVPTHSALHEMRSFSTGRTGWNWSSFCKTEYATDPQCGGIPNFLRCHIGLVTFIERVAEIPGLHVEYNDEGRYGEATYSDDWQEAAAAGRKATYVWHPGQYNVKALVKHIEESNQRIAAFAGMLKDALGGEASVDAPITQFQNFEQLEFKGCQNESIKPFLNAMKALAEKVSV